MKMYPKLKILLNKDLDKDCCFYFLNTKVAGVDLGGRIIQIHPQLSNAGKVDELSAKNLISKYFDKFYSAHQDELEQAKKEAENAWIKNQVSFFKACDKYFKNHPWPEGKYEAYPSIIECNPRFLENKTFQFYWRYPWDYPQWFLNTTAHEMLHFLFFDLVEKLVPNINSQNQKLWNISEVFNGLIMGEPEFIKITGVKIQNQYPDLIKTQEELRKVWNKNKDAKSFILSTLSS